MGDAAVGVVGVVDTGVQWEVSMLGKAAKVVISERQQVVLREWSRSKSEGRMIVQRTTIILRDGCRPQRLRPLLHRPHGGRVRDGRPPRAPHRRRLRRHLRRTRQACRHRAPVRSLKLARRLGLPAQTLTTHTQRSPLDPDPPSVSPHRNLSEGITCSICAAGSPCACASGVRTSRRDGAPARPSRASPRPCPGSAR